MDECTECGIEIPTGCRKCLACSKKAIQQMFSESPEPKQAFKETIEEMRKPENIAKMAAEIAPVIQAVAELQKAAQREGAGRQICPFRRPRYNYTLNIRHTGQ